MSTSRLVWRADKQHKNYREGDIKLGKDLADLAHGQTQIPLKNAKQLVKKSKTYWMTWDECSAFYQKHSDHVLPYDCEFDHNNCSDTPRGICVYCTAMFEHMRAHESSLLAAFHDERIQEILGPEAINEYYRRMLGYDAELNRDINKKLLEKKCLVDIPSRYKDQGQQLRDLYEAFKGPSPMVRADDPPEPPCKVF
jgi:hypothetical protein